MDVGETLWSVKEGRHQMAHQILMHLENYSHRKWSVTARDRNGWKGVTTRKLLEEVDIVMIVWLYTNYMALNKFYFVQTATQSYPFQPTKYGSKKPEVYTSIPVL